MENESEITQEALEEFSKLVQEAVDFVLSVYERERENKRLVRINDHVVVNLERLDRYIQATYYGNIRNGLVEDAIGGLMSGIRAAFLYGYECSQTDAEVAAYEEYRGGDIIYVPDSLNKDILQ